MSAKHTQGPWKYYWRQSDTEVDCGVYAENREGLAISVCRAPRFQTKEQWEIDASLIAAAPDLLYALTQMVDRFDCLRESLGHDQSDLSVIARAAIEKATKGA